MFNSHNKQTFSDWEGDGWNAIKNSKESNLPTPYLKTEFDKAIHRKYLSHIDIHNLKGLKVELIYQWKVGETLIIDRSHIHCSSSNIVNKKLGLTTFTKKK